METKAYFSPWACEQARAGLPSPEPLLFGDGKGKEQTAVKLDVYFIPMFRLEDFQLHFEKSYFIKNY